MAEADNGRNRTNINNGTSDADEPDAKRAKVPELADQRAPTTPAE